MADKLTKHKSPKHQIRNHEKEIIKIREEYDKKIKSMKKQFLKKGDLMNMDNKLLRDQITTLKTDLAIRENELIAEINELKKHLNGTNNNERIDHHEITALKVKLEQQIQSCQSDYNILENKIIESENKLRNDVLLIENLKSSKLQTEDQLYHCEKAYSVLKQDQVKYTEIYKAYDSVQNKLLTLKQSLIQSNQDRITAMDIAEQYKIKLNQLEQSSQETIRQLQNQIHNQNKKFEKSYQHMKYTENSTMKDVEQCTIKNQHLLTKSDQMHHKMKRLEHDVSKLMQDLSNSHKSHDEKVNHYEINIQQLKANLQNLSDENQKLLNVVSNIQQQASELQTTIQYNKEKHEQIKNQYKENKKDLEKCIKHRENMETDMVKAHHIITQLNTEKQHLEDKLQKNRYSNDEQKQTLENRLLDIINEKNALKESLHTEATKHKVLHDKIKDLEKENTDLNALKRKYEEDLDNLSEFSRQNVELTTQLNKSQDIIQKKNAQTTKLAQQLELMIERNKYLFNRENELKQKLEQSLNEEEGDKLNKRLLGCRNQMKTLQAKYHTLHELTVKLKKQNILHEHKIVNLVNIMKQSEDAKQEFNKERKIRLDLESALKQCKEDNKEMSKQLEMKLKRIEDQYKEASHKHQNDIDTSQKRVKELQVEYDALKTLEKPENQNRAMVVPPISKNQSSQSSEPNQSNQSNQSNQTEAEQKINVLEKYQNELKQKQSDLEMALNKLRNQMDRSSPSGPSSQSSQFNNNTGLQTTALSNQRIGQNQQLQTQESELIKIRQQTYDELLNALIASNTNTNPNNVYQQIDFIRKRGQQREQEKLADILRLRALSEKTETEYRKARQMEAEYLNRMSQSSKKTILQNMTTKNNSSKLSNSEFYTNQLRQPFITHNAIVNAQAAHYGVTRADSLQELANIQRYQEELQQSLFKMTELEKQVAHEVNKGSNIEKLKIQLEKEQQSTLKALESNVNAKTGEQRYIDSVESKLQALLATNNALINDIKAFVKSPTKETGIVAGTTLTTTPEDISSKIDFQRKLDQSLNTTFIIPGDNNNDLRYDLSRGLLFTKTGEVVNVDTLSEQGKQAWQLPQERAVRSIDKNNYVLVTYSYESAIGNLQESRRAIFADAIKEIYSAIDGKPDVNIQMVELLSGGQINDLINKNNKWMNGEDCTKAVGKLQSIKNNNYQEFFEYIWPLLPKESPGDPSSHVVLSISLPNHKTRLHIVDVFYSGAANSYELFDIGWVNYLKPVMELSTTKLDLIFALLPSKSMSDNEKRTKMIQLSIRLQAFLKQLNLFRRSRKMGN